MVLEGPQKPCRYAHLLTTPTFFASAADAILQNTSTDVGLQAKNLTGTKRLGLEVSTRSESHLHGSILVDPS